MKQAPKYKAIRDALLKSIREGQYAPGQRLPAEKELAIRFGVSHMTARQAVTELVESGTLERRVGSGAYVRSHGSNPSTDFTVHILCQAVENSLTRSFLRVALQEVATRGWKCRLTRIQSGMERYAIRVLDQGGYALVLADETLLHSSFGLALENANGRAVVIGNRLSDVGIPSVLADDRLAVRMAVRHLQEQGHTRIGLLSEHEDNYIARLQIEAWRGSISERMRADLGVLSSWLLVTPSSQEDDFQEAYDAVRRHLQQQNAITALICLSDELALVACAACTDLGYSVPLKMSIIASGDSPLMEFVRPAITCIDVDLRKHVQNGLELLQKRFDGSLTPEDLLRVVQPRLLIRQSVATARPDLATE